MPYNEQLEWVEDEPKRTVIERIVAGEFETKVPAPNYDSFRASLPEYVTYDERSELWKQLWDEYCAKVKADLVKNPLPHLDVELAKEHGLTGHPKANLLYSMAYDRGHSAGMEEVADIYGTLADLLK